MPTTDQKQYIYLGYPQRTDSPTPPAIPPIELTPFLTIAEHDANVTTMKLTSHTGTHLDVPRHVIADGNTLTDLSPEDFVFHRPGVFDLPLSDCEVVQPGQLEPFVEQGRDADILLFRFGYAKVRSTDPKRFSAKSPGFGVESAEFLLANFPRMRALGMDVPSLSCIEYLGDTFKAHHVLLGGADRHFIVIEDMNLDYDLGSLQRVIVAPLLVADLDGCPCTVIGELG